VAIPVEAATAKEPTAAAELAEIPAAINAAIKNANPPDCFLPFLAQFRRALVFLFFFVRFLGILFYIF
jgi:hypothetical protein